MYRYDAVFLNVHQRSINNLVVTIGSLDGCEQLKLLVIE